jgi:hypothetical protein
VAVATNLGTGGSVLDAQFGSSPTSNTNEPLLLSHTGTNYLYLPGVAGNYASTPDANALDITGDIDIRVRVALDDWSAVTQEFVAKFDGPTGSGRSYLFRTSSGVANRLEFAWQDSGTASVRTATSGANVSFANGAVGWVKCTFDADNGASGFTARFYTAPDQATEPTVWTQLGTDVTAATVATIATGTFPLVVGSGNTASRAMAGKFYRAIVRDGINGTTVFDADFTQGITSGAQTTFTATTGQTVTINRSTAGRKSVAVVRPVWLLGTDDFFEVADNALLDFDAGDSFTVIAVVRQWATPTNFGRYVSKKSSGLFGWEFASSGTTIAPVMFIVDATATSASNATRPTFTSGSTAALAIVVDRSAQTIRAALNGTLSATSSTSAVGSLANSDSLRIGGLSSGAGNQDFELLAVAVFRRALTAGELTAIAAYYGAV